MGFPEVSASGAVNAAGSALLIVKSIATILFVAFGLLEL
jgi:hypothetical protein